jgi:hypothetical protein
MHTEELVSLKVTTLPRFARPREQAMIAVIFESWPLPGKDQLYIDMGAALSSHLEKIDGFISVERFRSVADPDKFVARGKHLSNGAVRLLYRAATLAFFLQAKTTGISL